MTSKTSRIVALAISFACITGFSAVALAESGGPTVTLTSTTSSSTNASSIPVTATFSEGVTGLASTSLVTKNATIANLTGSSTKFSFNLMPTATGTVSVMVPANVATSSSTGKGNQASNTLYFTRDVTPPVISSIKATSTSSSTESVRFTTNEPAFGSIDYGTMTAYGASTTPESTASTTHAISLSSLKSATTYHFRVRATDAAGNTATSSDQTFMTASGTTTPTLGITNVSVTAIGTSTATISFSSSVAARGGIAYGTTTAYGASTTPEATSTVSHSFSLKNLIKATTYHFRVSATTASSTATSTDRTFTTLSTASSTPLAVTSVSTVRSSGIADNSFADGWHWILHLTVPTTEKAVRAKFTDFVNAAVASSSIPAKSNIRIYSPQSSTATSSSKALLESGNGYSSWMYLTGDTSTSTPGIQADLDVEVKIPSGTINGNYGTIYTIQSVPLTATSTTI